MWTENGSESPCVSLLWADVLDTSRWLTSSQLKRDSPVLPGSPPQGGCGGKEATGGAALAEPSASSCPALPEGALCTQAVTRQSRKGGKEEGKEGESSRRQAST